MTASGLLREAAAILRAPRAGTASCQCDSDEMDVWFDRSVCPEPCGGMHYYCNKCARLAGYCAVMSPDVTPSGVDAATADWLAWMADRSDSANGIPAMRGLGLAEAEALARAVIKKEHA